MSAGGIAMSRARRRAVVSVPGRHLRRHAVTLGLLVALVVANVAVQPSLLNTVQIGLTIEIALPLVLVGFAQTLVVISRGLDLSVGGTMAVGSVLAATWMSRASWLMVLAVLAVCVALGTVNGLLVAVGRFEPFVATLATWSIFNGIALTVLSQDGGTVPSWLTNLVTGSVGGIPNSYFLLAAVLVVWWHLRRTRTGRNLYALGSDQERARLNGAPVTAIKISVYAIAGAAAGIAGIVLAGATATGQPTVGDPYVLSSIAAVVIGGTSLFGGSGGVGATTIGVFILSLIATLVQSLGLESWVSITVSAALLLVVVVARSLPHRHTGGEAR